MYLENTTGAVNPPPLLIFDTPVIENLTVSIYGFVEPRSANVTIVSLLWDWGDGQAPEYHGFPNSHVYSTPGTYTFSITARQSDGQGVTETTKISVGQTAIPAATTVPVTPGTTVPGGPVMVIHAPVLTLLEPAIDRMNVTLNGNLNPGSPGVTIESVSVNWDDGSLTKSSDLPMAHRYLSSGIYTVSVTGNQSDGQSATKKIALEIKEEMSAPPGPTPAGPAPGNDLSSYLIIIAMAITGVVIIAVVMITQRRKEPQGVKDTPKAEGRSPAREPAFVRRTEKDMCRDRG